uniref:Uncharacterized protein n=1 Tax=Setaria italica TaxID=4555 RepID=K3YBE5_SETIT
MIITLDRVVRRVYPKYLSVDHESKQTKTISTPCSLRVYVKYLNTTYHIRIWKVTLPLELPVYYVQNADNEV